VNERGSRKEDFRKYCELKNRAIFQDDVYKYKGKVLTELNLRLLHPLLFTKVGELIDTTSKVSHKTTQVEKFRKLYPTLIEERLRDNKSFADGEMFSDRFMVIAKDINYGYALTSHKSQGSTYDVAYVDESDFKSISGRWNYLLRANELRHRERNQLRYVAYTRPSKKLRIVL